MREYGYVRISSIAQNEVIQMKDKEERNNLVVNVVAAVLIVAIIMLGLRSCSNELANLR